MTACDVQIIILFTIFLITVFDCNITAFNKYFNLFLNIYIYTCCMALALVENSSDTLSFLHI